jgi:hypothetical protein
VTTLALIPRRRPFHPSLATMILSASAIPRALRIRASLDVPRVCKRVYEQKVGCRYRPDQRNVALDASF